MKNIKLTIVAGVDSHMSGYDLVMSISSKYDTKLVRVPFKVRGLRGFYKKSKGCMSTRWIKKVDYQQYKKIFANKSVKIAQSSLVRISKN